MVSQWGEGEPFIFIPFRHLQPLPYHHLDCLRHHYWHSHHWPVFLWSGRLVPIQYVPLLKIQKIIRYKKKQRQSQIHNTRAKTQIHNTKVKEKRKKIQKEIWSWAHLSLCSLPLLLIYFHSQGLCSLTKILNSWLFSAFMLFQYGSFSIIEMLLISVVKKYYIYIFINLCFLYVIFG